MRLLDIGIKPQPIENLDIYNYAAVHLAQIKDMWFEQHGDFASLKFNFSKEPPLIFNCTDQSKSGFDYYNFVPNQTIINGFNERLQEFAKLYPEWKDEINERFSEYLWVNSEYDLNGDYKKPVIKCSAIEFGDILKNNPDIHDYYLDEKQAFEERFANERDVMELVFEYIDDEKAVENAMRHANSKGKNGKIENDPDGWEWRQKNVLLTLRKGHDLEIYVDDQLKKYGIDIGLIYDEKGQTNGETMVGIEFKNDLKSDETLNAYVEISESRHGGKQVSSGIMKNDNSKYLVFGPKENLLIVRKDVLLDYYDKFLKGKENNGGYLSRGVYQENAKYCNAVNEWSGHSGRTQQSDGQNFSASIGYIIRRDKLEELAEDFGIEGIARVIIADGWNYDKRPPEKELQIDRNRFQYVANKIKGFDNFQDCNGDFSPMIKHNQIESHEDNISYENKGVHLSYIDNELYNSLLMKDPKIQKLSQDIKNKKKELSINQARSKNNEAYKKYYEKTIANLHNEIEDLQLEIDFRRQEIENQTGRNITKEATFTAFIEVQEKRNDGMIRIPLTNGTQDKPGTQGLRHSQADKYIHVVSAPHNSKGNDTDITYEFDLNKLKRAINQAYSENRENFKGERHLGMKYLLVPEELIKELDRKYNIINRKQVSCHVNTTIDLENSDIRKELSLECQLDFEHYKTNEPPFRDDTRSFYR